MRRSAKVLPHLSVITIRRGLIGGDALVYEGDFSEGNFDQLIKKGKIAEINKALVVEEPVVEELVVEKPVVEEPVVEEPVVEEPVVEEPVVEEPVVELKYEIPRVGRKNRKNRKR